MLTYKSTTIIALNKKTQEEVARHLVTGDGLFTVAERECTAETCGTSEGAETPVRARCRCYVFVPVDRAISDGPSEVRRALI